jgi:nitroreductase/NAD-dependent dihydropyrimidine dehydrogenase PreA subunit
MAECPQGIIGIQDGTGYPFLIPQVEGMCNRCGHCVAACPHGALSHSDIPFENCPGIKKELILTEEQAGQFLRSRRSIRSFKDTPVEKETIQRLIETARCAPTGGNSQMVEWHVLTDRNKMHEMASLTIDCFRSDIKDNPKIFEKVPYLKKIVDIWESGQDIILRAAPVLVVAAAPVTAATGMVDLCIALSYMDLMAPAMGLGTCWAGLLQHGMTASPEIKKLTGVPADHPHHFPMMLGYPTAKYYRMPGRNPPKIIFDQEI